ncbi:MAG: M3 family oligoendopeptidase [Anaerolineae bacterium]|nr:M3 family oligoendopeptidase [Anaerolineae bacterium]
MSLPANPLPRWDLSAVFPGLESPEFAEGFESAVRAIDELVATFDRHDVARRDPVPLDEVTVTAFEEVVGQYNAVLEETRTLRAYIHGFVSTDSRNETAQARASELRQKTMLLSLLETRFAAWVGSLDVEALAERSALAREHAYVLRKARERASHLMAPDEEALAAEMDLTGGAAWAKLYGDFASQLTVAFELGGETRLLPMSAVRNLASDPDRAVRRQAYEAELAAWERAAVPIAAAMNGIKGQVNALCRRRGWGSPLDAALFLNNIDRQTLEAMMEAARESFPDFRRYLAAKARALGLSRLAWYDLFAPLEVGTGDRPWSFEDSARFILEQFDTYSPRLRALAKRAFGERWIDAEPRAGKRDGAFCMWLKGDASRILANYRPDFGGMSTLAHELGHAYHNLNLAGRTMLQRTTPMTLAETASIFCQTIVRHAALEDAGVHEQIAVLEADLQSACQVVVDISSRFLFERNALVKRQRRELSAAELCELMADAQVDTYGDGLDHETLHPYMWAAKPHYYSADRSFYNFPYMFGRLFGLGLYARQQADPEWFRAGYDGMLSSTGMEDAASLASRFGIELRTPGFWQESLDVIRADIDRFEELVDGLG